MLATYPHELYSHLSKVDQVNRGIPFVRIILSELGSWGPALQGGKGRDVHFPWGSLAILALFNTFIIGLFIIFLLRQRGPGQTVSKKCWALVAASVLAVTVACLLAGLGLVWWLDVFYLMSYLKLVITPVKYIPQVGRHAQGQEALLLGGPRLPEWILWMHVDWRLK